jgi:hypothetical protein
LTFPFFQTDQCAKGAQGNGAFPLNESIEMRGRGNWYRSNSAVATAGPFTVYGKATAESSADTDVTHRQEVSQIRHKFCLVPPLLLYTPLSWLAECELLAAAFGANVNQSLLFFTQIRLKLQNHHAADPTPHVVLPSSHQTELRLCRQRLGLKAPSGRKDFLPVEPQGCLSFLILLGEPRFA